jgi:disulfide bond formation protein DsbB
MKLHLTPRLGYLAGFLICGGLILYALYLQYYEYQDPCPLCLLQRVVYIVLMVVFLLGALHGPRRTGAVVYSTLLVLVSLIGAGIAGATSGCSICRKTRCPNAARVSVTSSTGFRSSTRWKRYSAGRANARKPGGG